MKSWDISSIVFTMDVHSHIIDGMQQDAMALLDEVLPEGVSKKINANFMNFSANLGVISFKPL